VSAAVRFALFQAVLLLPFAAGYLARRRAGDLSVLTRKLIRANLIFAEPLVVFWSVWGLKVDTSLLILPAAGLLLVSAGFIAGRAAAGLLRLSGARRATFIISASLANHGYTLGGFICYLFLGEQGLGHSFIFISYFMPFIFLFIFPYARAAAASPAAGRGILSEYLLNAQNMPIAALALALVLQLLGIRRIGIPMPIDIVLMISVAIYYFSLGTTFIPDDLRGSMKESAALGLVKFALLPLCTLAVLGHVSIAGPVKMVVVIQSFMPAAIYSVVTSMLFGLDTRKASSLFVVNTLAFLLGVLPALFLMKPCLFPP
jgi:predicted permease